MITIVSVVTREKYPTPIPFDLPSNRLGTPPSPTDLCALALLIRPPPAPSFTPQPVSGGVFVHMPSPLGIFISVSIANNGTLADAPNPRPIPNPLTYDYAHRG